MKSQYLSVEEILSSKPFASANPDFLVVHDQSEHANLFNWLQDKVAKSKLPNASDVNFASMRYAFITDTTPGLNDLELLLVTSDNTFLQTQVALWFKGTQDAVVQDIINFNRAPFSPGNQFAA